MVALRYLLGMEVTPDVFKCRNCENLYLVKNGVTALRRHYEAKHEDAFVGISQLFGLDKKHEMTPEKSIKLEEPEQEPPQEEPVDFQAFQHQEGPSIVADSECALQTTSSGKLPAWVPSSKGRSIVWEHIQWVAESQRAACNYCQAEFQIKGGTSALLRHLKTNHPAAINFDPDNPPPVIRRRKRKTIEDYTIVTEDTKSYMDNLLETFMHEDMMPRIDEDAPTSPQPHHETQNRADSEIDEVIRTLQNENAQNGFADVDEPDRNLRHLLGIVDEDRPPLEEVGDSGEKGAEPRMDEEKQVSSNVGPSPQKQQKRKAEDTQPMLRPIEALGLNGGKFPTLSAIHRRPPPPTGPPTGLQVPPPPFPTVPPPAAHLLSNQPQIMHMPGISAKYNAQAVQILDFEAKVLYNQSLHSTIAREDAMTTYYRMKSRKMELEIKKLERELGEEHDEQE